jgi:hypothetical protein
MLTERKTRLSGRVKAAIELMVWKGQKRDQAADSAGLHRDSLRKALKRPDVLAHMRAQMDLLRTSAAAGTISRAEHLMHNADSEHVQLDATKWLAGLEGLSPVAKSENVHLHRGMTPGLTIIYGDWKPHVIEGEAAPAASQPKVNMIGTPARHPLDPRFTASLPARVPHPSELAIPADEDDE